MSVTVSGTVLALRPKAILVDRGQGEHTWIPRSVIEESSDNDPSLGDEVDFEVARWFAEKEGLE